jgi:DNA repair protein RadC
VLATAQQHDAYGEMLLAAFFSMISDEGDQNELAASVWQSFGSLGRLLHASTSELQDALNGNERLIAGVDILRYSLERIVSERTSEQLTIKDPAAIAEYVAFYRNPTASGSRRAAFLDRGSRLLRDVSLAMSRSDSQLCRDIAQIALEADAFGLVLIEYLYKENIEPSRKIRAFDEKLRRTMLSIGIDVYDHIIVGIDCMYSCRQETILKF